MAVPFFRHSLSPLLSQNIAEVLASSVLTSGPQCKYVEEKLRSFFDVKHAQLTSSWTQGAISVLLSLDIGPGDEVIVPAMTFAATANVVRLVGATPVFVDVDPTTLLISRTLAVAAVTSRTKAIIPVHLYGQMVDIPALRSSLPARIRILEDAAHCFEGSRDGRRPGRDSDAAIFSFYATKNITCGEGGAVICNDAELFAKVNATVRHGVSASAIDRFKQGFYHHWDVERLGTKANLTDLLAVLLGPQIDTVEANREQRQRLCDRYKALLSSTVLEWPSVEAGVTSACHLFPVRVPDGERDRVLLALNQAGIHATVNYRSVPSLTLYRGYGNGQSFPVANAWGESTLSLPLFPTLTHEEQDEVASSLHHVLKHD